MKYDGNKTIFHSTYGDALTLDALLKVLCRRAGVPNYPVEYVTGGVVQESLYISLLLIPIQEMSSI